MTRYPLTAEGRTLTQGWTAPRSYTKSRWPLTKLRAELEDRSTIMKASLLASASDGRTTYGYCDTENGRTPRFRRC